jgi:hypothetical protein
MQHFAAFDEEGVVRYFLCESMLEDVLHFWKRRLLVDKLARL